MPRGNPNWVKKDIEPAVVLAAVNMDEPPVQLVTKIPVKLLYNYVPRGEYDIVGWHKPAIERKNAAGQMIVVEPAKFIEKEPAPPPYPGVGYPNKIWKETVIALPREEAIGLVQTKRAERADAFPA